MREKQITISANEINRYTYCPYQWYYGKVYGQKVLKEKYQALGHGSSKHEHHFKRGIRFHQQYYKAYRFQRRLKLFLLVSALLIIIGSMIKCFF